MSQRTLHGEEAPLDRSLDEGEPQVWDDGTANPTWHCPDCGARLFAEATCSCGWFDRERWDATLGGDGDGR